MNVTVEQLGPCKKLIRIEIDVQAVDRAFTEVTSSFQKQASLPGFRPGKVPSALIAKNFASRIEEEAKRKLISDSYNAALKEHKIKPVSYPDVEEIQFGRGQAMQFAITLEFFPEFEPPPYCGIQVTRENGQVTEKDMERALGVLQTQSAKFQDVDRPLQAGDFAVVNYKGTIESKPIAEFSPSLKGLSERENFWMHLDPENKFIPGLADQLIGAQQGSSVRAAVKFPEDFAAKAVAGKDAEYVIDVLHVKERILPIINDEFSKTLGAKNLDHLCEEVRKDLEKELKFKQKRNVRDQIVKFLVSNVQFELPESVVSNETRSVVYDIVRENQSRGVEKEAIDQNKDAIYSAASASAKDRVKVGFILGKIAELEKISANQQEVVNRIYAMSQSNQIPFQKFLKQLQEREAIPQIAEQIATEKVMDFLELHAKVTDIVGSSSADAQAAVVAEGSASDAPVST